MADEKEPMQASGKQDGVGADIAEETTPPSAGRPDMEDNAGQSGGGAYPNPHTGKDKGGFDGGQSDPRYLGNEAAESENAVNDDD